MLDKIDYTNKANELVQELDQKVEYLLAQLKILKESYQNLMEQLLNESE